MIKIPKYIQIGATKVRVLVKNQELAESGSWGKSIFGKSEIWIATKQDGEAISEQTVMQTLFHEIQHYIFKTHGFGVENDNEQLVDICGLVWYQVFKQLGKK